MEENKNVEVTEVKEGTKKEATKQIQKNFKFSTEVEKDEINEILSALTTEEDVKNKVSDGTKILRALRSVLSESDRANIVANSTQTLAKVFESTFIEVELMQRNIVSKYQALMTVANLEVKNVREELTQSFEKKLAKSERNCERLEQELARMTELKEELEVTVKNQNQSVVDANTRVTDLVKNLETQEQTIELYQAQLKDKDDLIEEGKRQIVELNETIAKLTTSQQDSLTKVEELRGKIEEMRTENEDIKASYQKDTQVINQLSLEVKEKDIKIEYSEKEIARLSDEIARVNKVNKIEIERLQKELENERQSKSDLLIKFMDKLSTHPTPTVEVEDGGKDTQSTHQPTKVSYRVLDKKGKPLFEGNKTELVKYVNAAVKPEPRVTNKTKIDVMEELLRPCVLKVIEK